MRTTAVCLAVAAALAATTSAEAVVLNPNGTGQVLVYPYYTVNAGFGTLLSIVNTTSFGKALKVRAREGYEGRSVVDFNLYLSPFDVWVAQIFAGGGGAAIASNDNSCTVPAFVKVFGPTPGAVGPGVLYFSADAYSGTNSDGGPTSIERTREGYIEVIEMGKVTDAQSSTLDAITHDSAGVPANCGQLVSAWDAGAAGYWVSNANIDLAPPGGGLYGSESIIDVGRGLMYAIPAAAIDGFSTVVQHTAPGSPSPDLGTASPDPDGSVAAFVPAGSGMVEARFGKPEDAISALFMADRLYDAYVVDPGLDAATDWIVTFPTKRFYTDPALVGTSHRPFDEVFRNVPPTPPGSCSVFYPRVYDREERTIAYGGGFSAPNIPLWDFCYAVNAVTFAAQSATPVSMLSSSLTVADPVELPNAQPGSGHVIADLTHGTTGDLQTNHVLVSINGVTLTGLPALGFAAIDYVNGNATPGMLANYSGAYPHRSTVGCTDTLTPQSGCGAEATP